MEEDFKSEVMVAKGFRAFMDWAPDHELHLDEIADSHVSDGVRRVLDVLLAELEPDSLTPEEAFNLRGHLMGRSDLDVTLRIREKLENIATNGGCSELELGRAEAVVILDILDGKEDVNTESLNLAVDLLDELAELSSRSEREQELDRKLETAYQEIDRLEIELDDVRMPVDEQIVFGVETYRELSELNRKQAENIAARLESAGKFLDELQSHLDQMTMTLGWKNHELVPSTQEKLNPVPKDDAFAEV